MTTTPATTESADSGGTLDIAALSERYAQTFATRDTRALGALHSEDGVFWLHTGQEAARGRSAIETAFAEVFETWPNLRFRAQRTLFGADFWVLDWVLFADFGDQTVEFELTDTVALDRDGLVHRKDTWVNSDQVARALAALSSGARSADPVSDEPLRLVMVATTPPETFEAFIAIEDRFLALFERHGLMLEQRLRAPAQHSEVQVIRATGRAALEGYLRDPDRLELLPRFEELRVTQTVLTVEDLPGQPSLR